MNLHLVLQRTTARGTGAPTVVWRYPKTGYKAPAPDEVPEHVARDYNEASLVLYDSPRASAALSRRCLQTLLRESAAVKPSDLSKEIKEVMPKLPSHLAESIDAIREIGNFGAHPIKDENTGEIIDVEPGEAEWNLDTLEGLFDFYYVQPELTKKRKSALNEKLKSAGKPPLKEPSHGEDE